MFTLLALHLSLAHAADPIQANLIAGATAAAVRTATTPVPVATFTFKGAEYTVGCKGASPTLSCAVRQAAVLGFNQAETLTSCLMSKSGNRLITETTIPALGGQKIEFGLLQ